MVFKFYPFLNRIEVQKLLAINSEDFLNPKGLVQVVKALVLEVCFLQGPRFNPSWMQTSLGATSTTIYLKVCASSLIRVNF